MTAAESLCGLAEARQELADRDAGHDRGLDRAVHESGRELQGWALDQPYRVAGVIARGHDCYATQLIRHSLSFG